jgi:hypothetical protein
MHQYSKLGVIACIAIFAASVQVRAADMAWASGALADIYVAMTEANFAKASAAESPSASAKAKEHLANVVEAAEAALAAYKEMEAAGEGDAAEAAKALETARQKALGGTAPVATPTEGGYKLPNPNRVLWESEGLQKIYEELFQIVESTSAKGGAEFTEYFATPE